MPMAGGITLLAVGAILTFALTESIQGIDLQAVGVILMLAGALALLLPRLMPTRQRSNQPAARSRQDAVDDGTLVELPDNDLALEDERRAQDRRRLWVRRSRG
jgi:hypothetical protein